jgi:uncharacterized protein (TIGR01244 family)
MKFFALSCVFLASCSVWYSQDEPVAQMPSPTTLPIVNFAALSGTVVGGGALDASVVATLPNLGFSTIINLQHAEEDGVAAEAEAAAAVGLDYISLPMGGLDFTREQALTVAETVNNAEGFVVLHCRSGARVTAIWALAEALDHNLSAEEAADIARNHGCREIPESMVQRVVELLDAN